MWYACIYAGKTYTNGINLMKILKERQSGYNKNVSSIVEGLELLEPVHKRGVTFMFRERAWKKDCLKINVYI